MTANDLKHRIRENIAQVSHQLIQVLLVGFAIDMRSRSRLGKIDRGTNARRITAFLSDIETRILE